MGKATEAVAAPVAAVVAVVQAIAEVIVVEVVLAAMAVVVMVVPRAVAAPVKVMLAEAVEGTRKSIATAKVTKAVTVATCLILTMSMAVMPLEVSLNLE